MSDPLYLRGSTPAFNSGTLTINTTTTIVRTYQYNPVDPGYLDRVLVGYYPGYLAPELVRSFDFRGGELEVANLYPRDFTFSATPTTFGAGRLSIVAGAPPAVGAFTDFAAYPATAHDPQEFYVASATAANSGAVGAAWTRHNAIFGVSRGLETSSKVAYLALGARFASVPTGTKQYLSKVMLERATLDGTAYPTAYSKAREIRSVIHPDRLNFSANPAFAVDTTFWTASAGGTLTRVAYAGAFAGQVAITSNSTADIAHTVTNLVPGRRYVASLLVAADGRPNATIFVTGGTLVASQAYATAETDPLGNSLRCMWIVFDAAATTVIHVQPAPVVGTPNVYVTRCLVEEGYLVKSYFDGGFGPDYLWETGGTTGKTRSYYYKNRAERYAAVKRIIANNVPMGLGIADPQIAVLPVE